MSYITRNANILLLFLIIISSTALVGATVYFQNNFDKINEAYNLKLAQLNEISSELDKQQRALDDVRSELSIKSAREQQLGEQYQVVQSEKETLEGQKEQLTQQKTALESELTETESELSSAKNSLEAEKALSASLQEEVTELTGDVQSLGNQVDDLEDDIDNLNAKISCLESTEDANEGDC
ncbi:hypothetical protein GF358_02025 [Candidatus Woesearchaeota archaeon]|nr:hypothetical protein [Candidatus Woesearchaeota archaeon]